jgi:hypothetical protein
MQHIHIYQDPWSNGWVVEIRGLQFPGGGYEWIRIGTYGTREAACAAAARSSRCEVCCRPVRPSEYTCDDCERGHP